MQLCHFRIQVDLIGGRTVEHYRVFSRAFQFEPETKHNLAAVAAKLFRNRERAADRIAVDGIPLQFIRPDPVPAGIGFHGYFDRNPERGVIRFRRFDLLNPVRNPFPECENLIGELFDRRRELQAGDRGTAHHQLVTDRTEPSLRNAVRIQNAEDCSGGGGGAVGIHAAVCRITDGFSEISAAGEQRQRGEGKVDPDIGFEFGGVTLEERIAHPLPVSGGVPEGAGGADSFREQGLFREIGQRCFDEHSQVGFDECERFECGKVHLRIHAVTGVVDAGVLTGESDRKFRVARREAGPEFAADRRSHSIDVEVIVAPRPRRPDAEGEIPHCHGIFVTVEIHVANPDFRQNLPIDLRMFHPVERGDVHRLKLKVVVRHGGGGDRIIKGEMVFKREALVWPAEGSADIFPHPAGQHLVPKILNCTH